MIILYLSSKSRGTTRTYNSNSSSKVCELSIIWLIVFIYSLYKIGKIENSQAIYNCNNQGETNVWKNIAQDFNFDQLKSLSKNMKGQVMGAFNKEQQNTNDQQKQDNKQQKQDNEQQEQENIGDKNNILTKSKIQIVKDKLTTFKTECIKTYKWSNTIASSVMKNIYTVIILLELLILNWVLGLVPLEQVFSGLTSVLTLPVVIVVFILIMRTLIICSAVIYSITMKISNSEYDKNKISENILLIILSVIGSVIGNFIIKLMLTTAMLSFEILYTIALALLLIFILHIVYFIYIKHKNKKDTGYLTIVGNAFDKTKDLVLSSVYQLICIILGKKPTKKENNDDANSSKTTVVQEHQQ